MMNEVGELTEKNKVFVAVCEAAVKPETFEYAKWKGIGRPSGRRGGCRSATTLRPYPSGRRPRTESASERVPHIHDLADATYDSETIRESSVEEGNQPIIDCNRRKADEAPKMTEAEREAYKARGNDERLFAHLLDAHGGRHVRVRDPKKVWQHLMYGVLVVVVEQTMRSAMLC